MAMIQPLEPRGKYRYIYRSKIKRMVAGLFDMGGAFFIGLFTLGRGLKFDPDLLHHPKKILVARLDHIGDVLFCRPALQALRWHYPEAQIFFLTSAAGASLMAQEKTVDHVIAWDTPWFRRGPQKNKPPGFFSMIGALRREKFDLSLDLRGDLRHHIIFFLARIKIRAGYTITGGRFLLHLPCTLAVGKHEVERNLHIITQLGGRKLPEIYAPLMLTEQESQIGLAFWKSQGPKVVIHPSAGDHTKQWAARHFAQLCDQLHEIGCEIILIGTQQEKSTNEKVMQMAKHVITDCAGQTELRSLAALITAADCFIGNDSGPAHLAITQGCATIMIWSETNTPEEWGPWGKKARAKVVRRSTAEREIQEVVKAARYFIEKETEL